jgi:hypothetical protein
VETSVPETAKLQKGKLLSAVGLSTWPPLRKEKNEI